MARLPEGTITFMLTDLQGSSQAWEKQPKAMRGAMARHDAILASAVGDHEGELVEAGREGDKVLAVFRAASSAAMCAVDIQTKFASESWPKGLDLKVRVALHTGEAQLREGHYFGAPLNRCARLLAICHPGQILLTKATEAMLVDEVPPGAELQDLGPHRLKDLARSEQVFQLNDLARPSDFPRIASPPQKHTNMPRYLTNFVGRAADLNALQAVLTSSRLVTLTGAGGSGKTRLAAELGRTYQDLWPGGVWWVDLAPVTDSRQLPGAVLAALDLPGPGPALDVITAWLAARRAVLILDNCEHLVAACAQFCQEELQRCPELTIIATSQEALGVQGEARWSVSPMASTEAVQLFETRARLVTPDFRITTPNLQTVTQICLRLDGMPLAIELAAARLDMLSDREILSQLSDRFHLLTGGSRTAPVRQQTMSATIDWSYRLLTEDEAMLFRRLSVFRGGFTLESAQAVWADGIADNLLGLLAGLVRKSMVAAERAEHSGTRYRLLASQLAYAGDRLIEAHEEQPARRRHYEYFRDGLSARTIAWTGPRAVSQRPPGVSETEWIVQESPNLWVAMHWARDSAEDLGLSLAVDLARIRSIDANQARSMLADLLERSPDQGSLRSLALARAGHLAYGQGDYRAAIQAAEASAALGRDIGDLEAVAYGLNLLALAQTALGETHIAAEAFEQAAALLSGSANQRLASMIRHSAANLALQTGDFTTARDIQAALLATGRAQGDVFRMSASLNGLAWAQLALEEHEAAGAAFKECLAIDREIKNHHDIIDCLQGLVCVAASTNDNWRVLQLAAAAGRMSAAWSLSADPWAREHAEASQRQARSRLGTDKSEEAWKGGWAMSLDQAIDYAIGAPESERTVDASPLSRFELDADIAGQRPPDGG